MAQPTPASASMPYLQQIPGVGQTYYGPYIQQGQQSNQIMGQQYGNLVNDPTGFINSIMGNYQQSPYATYQENLMTDKMNNTAAAGGYAGTPYNQGQVATTVQEISSRDMNQWLNEVLGMYSLGLMGEGTLSNQGFQASNRMADLLSNNLQQEGNLAFSNQAQENQNKMNRNSNWANLIGAGAGLGMSLIPFM